MTNHRLNIKLNPPLMARYKYLLIDSHTEEILKEYEDGKGHIARRRADRLDLQYGAVRYIVKPVKVEG